MSENSWSSLGFDWGPNLEDRSPRAGEPRSRNAHMDDLYRFSLLAAMFVLALLIEYLAH